MRYLKLYENLNDPQVGDYVLCREYPNEIEGINMSDLERFLCNHIGKLVNPDEKYKKNWTSSKEKLEHYIWVKYSNKDLVSGSSLSGDEFVRGIRPFMRKEIIQFSPDKSDLEVYLAAKKYNL